MTTSSTTNAGAFGAMPAVRTPDALPSDPRLVGERVAILDGDRLCARCSYNLSGLMVVREPTYGMLMIRCPECGTAACLQEYPLLGRWAGRVGFGLAAVWVLGVLGFFLINVAVIAATSEAIVDDLLRPYVQSLQVLSQKARELASPPAPTTTYFPYGMDMDWWNAQDSQALFAQAGGWTGGINWNAGWFTLLMAVLVYIPFGIVWSVLLPHARWRRLGIIAGVLLGLGGAFFWFASIRDASYSVYGPFFNPVGAARRQFAWTLGVGAVALTSACVFGGMLIGRRLARALAVLFVPPRLRGALAFLWHADGKKYVSR